MVDLASGADLALEAADGRLVRVLLVGEDLERDDVVLAVLAGAVDGAHAAAAELD